MAIVALSLSVLVGCSRSMELMITGESDLNGGGNAARIHVFQLSNNALFESATVSAFWNSPEDALGSDMVDHAQILLYPNESIPLQIELRKEAKYVAIAAKLRDPDPNQWRQIYPLSEVKRKALHVSVGSRELLVSIE